MSRGGVVQCHQRSHLMKKTPTRFVVRVATWLAVGFFALPLLAVEPATAPAATSASQPAMPLRFVISFPKAILDQPFTGRAVVWLSRENPEPRIGPNWFHPEPIYSARFSNIAPGTPMSIDDGNCVGFPGKITDLEGGEWIVQAVLDRNLGGRAIGQSAGNLFSKPVTIKLDAHTSGDIEIACDEVVPERELTDTGVIQFIKLRSALLSDFYHRDTYLRAGIIVPTQNLPPLENGGVRKFPTIYSIPGFGGGVDQLAQRTRAPGTVAGIDFISVALDANCPTGHSVFADSDNNGPWGKALTTELIPDIEAKFPAIPRADARFVTGHSSGGWSSLWLQVTYPTVFGGCWSTSPDPVDFRDFQQINLYQPGQNLFIDEHGQPRPLARQNGKPSIFYKQFTQMERPIRGEQIGSFEAVFGTAGSDGEPAHLYDRDSGAIDPKIVEAWKRYDIGLILREHWNELAPNLAGKIHVYVGDTDTFYLDGAVRLLKSDLNKINADATVEIVSGDHQTMMTRELRARISREMADQFKKHATDNEERVVTPTSLPTTRRAA